MQSKLHETVIVWVQWGGNSNNYSSIATYSFISDLGKIVTKVKWPHEKSLPGKFINTPSAADLIKYN